MTQKDNILQELNELKSTLTNITSQNVYAVPPGYFDGLVEEVLSRIKAIETNTAEELGYLFPMLNSISKQMPYSLPLDYFEGLSEKAMQSVRETSDYQTAKEELETISPLLSSLRKQMPYSVPTGYFDSLSKKATEQQEAKIISITKRKWFRYAAAAVVTGMIAIGGLMYFTSRNRVDPAEQPYAWVKKNIKKVDQDAIDAFVKLADEELVSQSSIASNPVKPDEIKELMKDVSDKELQDFLDNTPEAESSDDVMMN